MPTVKEILKQRKQARTKIHEYLKAAASLAHELEWSKDRFLTVGGFAFYMKGDVFSDLSVLRDFKQPESEEETIDKILEGESLPETVITTTSFICDDCVAERGGVKGDDKDSEGILLEHKLCLRHERMREKEPSIYTPVPPKR